MRPTPASRVPKDDHGRPAALRGSQPLPEGKREKSWMDEFHDPKPASGQDLDQSDRGTDRTYLGNAWRPAGDAHRGTVVTGLYPTS